MFPRPSFVPNPRIAAVTVAQRGGEALVAGPYFSRGGRVGSMPGAAPGTWSAGGGA